uniref:uncharacterized protein LOC120333023 n=1 Tax=Styela clava TaxID=7725 RepID=UPI00193A02DE|nr:uncharacterized protein LOC120333023 [Styela clava]
MADQGQQQEGANIVNIQGSNINEVHGEVIQVDNIQQAQAEIIHAGNIQHLHLHYDNNAAPPPVAQQPQVQADAGSAGNMQEEMPSTSGSASRLQIRERRNVDLEYSNQDLLVAGSASLLQTEEPTNVEINESNIHIMGGEGMITKGEGATTIIRDSVIIIGERSRDGATTAQRKNEFADARLASNDLPCPVYEETPPRLGVLLLQLVQRATRKGNRARKFINYFNNRTWEQTKVKITENYKEAKLKEPDFEVNPQIRKVPRFYRGEMAPKVTEYTLETGFTVRATDNKVGEIISLDVLVEHLSNKEYRYIAILGQAGSGKSTIMKRLARSLLAANKLVKQAQISEGLRNRLFGNTGRRFKFIHHLNIKDILFLPGNRAEEAISPCELLFGKLAFGLATQDVGEGYEWLQENQSMCILFLDGLDQATWNLLGKYNKMKYTDKSSTATIMWNLITGNLFPRMTIVISSREHRIASLPLELRPQFITALAGFTRDEIERMFIAVVGDDGEKAWEKLTRQSPALIPLSSVPLFLIFNAIVCKFNPEKLPGTMTEVMLRILHIFMRSDHTHERKRIEEILPNLMGMSFEGTKNKRVIFTINDLTKFLLQSDEVRDIIIKVPGKNMFNQHLMEGDHLMFFSHQVLQEVLSALYISNMDSTTFRKFIETEFQDDHWAVVRHLLGGIILNPDIESSLVTNFSPDARQDEKKKILREFLSSQSYEEMESYQKLELYGTLYEANDTDLIQSCIREIEFSGESFTTAGMHVMSSDIRRCNHLTRVRLKGCYLNAELVHILMSNLEGSCLKLDELNVSLNKDLGPAGWAEVGLVVTQCQVKVFKAWGCKLTAEGMKAFKENTGNAKLDKLVVSYNEDLEPAGWGEVGLVVTQCQVKVFKAEVCKLTAEGMKAFKENTLNVKLDELDVGRNIDLGTAGWGEVGLVVTQCQVKVFKARGCNLTAEGMKAFKENTLNAKLDKLDVSFNEDLEPAGWAEVGLVVTQCHVKVFTAWSCKLTAERMKVFKENTLDAKLDELDVSGNMDLEPAGWAEVGLVVTQCQVKVFKARYCNPTAEEMKVFNENTGNAKLDELYVGHNEYLGPAGWAEVGLVVTQCQVKVFKARGCKLTAEGMKAFKENTGNAKLDELDVSHNRDLEPAGWAEVGLVVTQCQVKVFKAWACDLTAEEMKVFKENTGNAKLNELVVSGNKYLGTAGLAEVGCFAMSGIIKIEKSMKELDDFVCGQPHYFLTMAAGCAPLYKGL